MSKRIIAIDNNLFKIKSSNKSRKTDSNNNNVNLKLYAKNTK